MAPAKPNSAGRLQLSARQIRSSQISKQFRQCAMGMVSAKKVGNVLDGAKLGTASQTGLSNQGMTWIATRIYLLVVQATVSARAVRRQCKRAAAQVNSATARRHVQVSLSKKMSTLQRPGTVGKIRLAAGVVHTPALTVRSTKLETTTTPADLLQALVGLQVHATEATDHGQETRWCVERKYQTK